MLKLIDTDKVLWDAFRGELRADYAVAMAQLPQLPKAPRTERGMKAWAEHAVGTLYLEAERATKRADYCVKLQAPGLAQGLIDQAQEWSSLAAKLAAHL